MIKGKRIHDVVRELDLSANTIRRLEAQGFIKPNRSLAGQRIFTDDVIEQIREIYLKRSGRNQGIDG